MISKREEAGTVKKKTWGIYQRLLDLNRMEKLLLFIAMIVQGKNRRQNHNNNADNSALIEDVFQQQHINYVL